MRGKGYPHVFTSKRIHAWKACDWCKLLIVDLIERLDTPRSPERKLWYPVDKEEFLLAVSRKTSITELSW
jgi:hypothetical protein